MNVSAAVVVDVPDEVVTVTFTVPAPAGLVAVIEAAELTVTLDAVLEPKLTLAPAPKPAPVIVTAVPPSMLPEVGLSEATLGGDAPETFSAMYLPLVPLLS